MPGGEKEHSEDGRGIALVGHRDVLLSCGTVSSTIYGAAAICQIECVSGACRSRGKVAMSGWEKGQVENRVSLVRERFFTARLRFKT
jgi:hypothetical protein